MGVGSLDVHPTFPQKYLQTSLCIPSHNHLVTLTHVDYLTFLINTIPVLCGHQEVPDVFASFEMYLDPHLTANLVKAFPKLFGVWGHHVDVPVVVAGWVVVVLVLDNAVSIVAIGLKSV